MSLKCILQGQDSKNLVTKVELNEHIADKSNPHEVTAEQVGAMHDYGLITPENLQTWVSEQKFSGTFLLTPSTAQGVPKPRYWFGEFIIISKDTFNDFAIYLFTDAEFYCCVTSSGQWSNSWLQIHPNKYHTNPNLLDNWYFINPVNQRGQTEYTAAGYTIDRWKFNNNNSDIVIDDTGIMFTAKYQYAEFEQRYEFPKNISGKQITISILADSFSGEGDFYLVIQNQTEYQTFHLSVGLNSFTTKFFDESSVLRLFIQGQNVNETNPPKIHLLAAKLELGSAQTLAHKENEKWVLNEIPDYGEQLRRCQRYCKVIGGTVNQPFCIAVRRETTVLEGFIPIDNPFRTAPSISVNGYFSTIPDFMSVKFTSGDTLSPQGVSLFFERHDGGTFDKDAYLIYAGADTRITFSADL